MSVNNNNIEKNLDESFEWPKYFNENTNTLSVIFMVFPELVLIVEKVCREYLEQKNTSIDKTLKTVVTQLLDNPFVYKNSLNPISKYQNLLGIHYMCGLTVKKDYKKAIEYFKLSDNSNARINLGCMYYMGWGVDIDYKKAYEYMNIALCDDRYILIELLFDSERVPLKNGSEAYKKWLTDTILNCWKYTDKLDI